jgi:hypothetical protein
VAKGADGLLLRPRSVARWGLHRLGFVLIGLGLYLAWLVWLGPAGFDSLAGWLMALGVALLLIFSAVKPLLLYRDHFDRQAELLTLGWLGLKGKYPLPNVLGVQLVPGGLVAEGFGESVSYQLNLVLADIYEDRLNLTHSSDLSWTRQAGEQIADFLGVPLIDQIAEGD